MQRISAAWFADLGAALVPVVNSFPGASATQMTVYDLYRLRDFLNLLADENVYPLDLRASRPVIQQLLYAINSVLNEPVDQQPGHLDLHKFSIWNSAQKLSTLLSGELAVQPIYHLWPVRAFNIEVLVSQGQIVFSEGARAEFNEEEVKNFQEAGKCLAFQIPTAAAFHIFRGGESLIRRYYEVVVGKLPKKKMRNWGVYIRNLKESGADQKVLAILEQVKDLHRNPVIHPEISLTLDEAVSLIGIMDSAITAMVADMKKRREETSPSLPFSQPAVAASESETRAA